MTTILTTGGTPFASSWLSSDNYLLGWGWRPANAFDGDTTTIWSAFVTVDWNTEDNPQWIGYRLSAPAIAGSYTIFPRHDGYQFECPTDWLFQGTEIYGSSGESWVTLDAQSGQNVPVEGQTFTFMPSATPYLAYRLYCTKNGSDRLALTELIIYSGTLSAGPPCTCTASLSWQPPAGSVTATLTATPNSLTAGEVTTLAYTTTGAHLAAIDHGVGPVFPLAAGSVPAAPERTETLTLSALGDWLTSVSATADVTVEDATPDDGPDGCVWRLAPAPACTGWKKRAC